jgi:ribulose-phosphate 3-epimerase
MRIAMTNNILVAPSLLSADFARLEEEIKKIESSGAEMIHMDIMDGHFVPNITIGPVIVKAIRKCTDLILDAHLMIENPHRYIESFIDAGSDIVTIHAEAYSLKVTRNQSTETRIGSSRTTDKIDVEKAIAVLKEIRAFGKKAGIALNPDSGFCIKEVLKEADMILFMSVHPGFGGQEFISAVLPKIKQARMVYNGDIQVDGGINDKNRKFVIDAGANILVAGSYFFGAKDPKEAVRLLKGV